MMEPDGYYNREYEKTVKYLSILDYVKIFSAVCWGFVLLMAIGFVWFGPFGIFLIKLNTTFMIFGSVSMAIVFVYNVFLDDINNWMHRKRFGKFTMFKEDDEDDMG